MSRRRLLVLAAGIAVAVVVLLCLRPFGGGTDQAEQPASPPPPAPAPVGPPPGAPLPSPAEHVHEDEEEGLVTGVEALAPAQVPEAVRAAERFAAAVSGPDWATRAAELATPALAASLAEPVEREPTGPGFVLLDAPEWARIGVPADRGTIVVDVTMVDGRWLVSALAWWPEGAS